VLLWAGDTALVKRQGGSALASSRVHRAWRPMPRRRQAAGRGFTAVIRRCGCKGVADNCRNLKGSWPKRKTGSRADLDRAPKRRMGSSIGTRHAISTML
jgi:hypothetical protein